MVNINHIDGTLYGENFRQMFNKYVSSNGIIDSPSSIYLSIYLDLSWYICIYRVLALSEKQTTSSMIWNRIAISISCDDNYYPTITSTFLFITSDDSIFYTYVKLRVMGQSQIGESFILGVNMFYWPVLSTFGIY